MISCVQCSIGGARFTELTQSIVSQAKSVQKALLASNCLSVCLSDL